MAPFDAPKTMLRQDAQIRRDRIVHAAMELFLEEGLDVPFEKIAERANVGRATLYRNFPDRNALSLATIHVYLDRFYREVAACGDSSEAFFVGIRALARLTISTNGFEKSKRVKRLAPMVHVRFDEGIKALLAEPLERAKAAGLILPEFPIDDVFRMALMVAGGGLQDIDGDTERAIDRTLALLMQGLAPKPAASGAPGGVADEVAA